MSTAPSGFRSRRPTYCVCSLRLVNRYQACMTAVSERSGSFVRACEAREETSGSIGLR